MDIVKANIYAMLIMLPFVAVIAVPYLIMHGIPQRGSFSDYLNDLRISRAKTMLINPSYTAGYIASELGFCNQSYFQVIFKRKVGTTPGEYRAQLAEQEKES